MHLVSPENEMDNWDEDPADPVVLKNATGKSKWEGEDAEEDVKDSWDQDPEEEKSDEEIKPQPPPTSTKKNLKKIGEKFDEKEKKKRQELETTNKELTAEELLVEKVRQQNLQEESDRILAKEIFGVSTESLETKEDFDKFKTDILNVVADSNKNANFVAFAEQLVQGICLHLSSIDLKKINTLVSNLHIEKGKLEKGDKSKKNKGKGKAKLKMEGDNDYTEYSAYTTEDFDDFI